MAEEEVEYRKNRGLEPHEGDKNACIECHRLLDFMGELCYCDNPSCGRYRLFTIDKCPCCHEKLDSQEDRDKMTLFLDELKKTDDYKKLWREVYG